MHGTCGLDRKRALLSVLLLLFGRGLGAACFALLSACSSSLTTGGGDGGWGADLAVPTNETLAIMPPDLTVDVTAGGPAGTGVFHAMAMAMSANANGGGPVDVSAAASWFVDDASLGSAVGGVFTSKTMRGGTTTVRAQWMGLEATATVHVKLHVVRAMDCPKCPLFPPLPGVACANVAPPAMVYPPDGVLLPPNMNVLQIQFMPSPGLSYYEIDFENNAIDVRVQTACNPVKDTRGVVTGGCAYDLDQATWDFISASNRGGEAVIVSVRATEDGTCTVGSASRQILFAEVDMRGGLYYWQSLVVGGVAGKTGGIYRYDFGARGTTGTAFLTPAIGSCVGCHFLSRDGQRMTYGTDDADSDDEYADLSGHLLNVANKTVIKTTSASGKPLPPGFQTFTHDHKTLLGSDGQNGSSMGFPLWDGEAGGAQMGTASTVPARGTQPDWSADDTSVVYVVPQRFGNKFTPNPYGRADDDHFMGGSLYTVTWDAMKSQFGMPRALVISTGENNYYPSYSPDTPPSFVVFNRASDPALTTDLARDAFNNPYARVFVLSTKANSTPVETKALNGGPASMTTNSWPRWSPFVQTYRGQKLLWVTFSSTRDYGIRVRNHVKVPGANGAMVDQANCYPPDSPQNLNGSHSQPLPPNCNQPQIWMAAINLATAEFGTDDPSYPAFWLPFQEVSAHNHIAQWTQTVVSPPCADGGVPLDGGACLADGAKCGQNPCALCCDPLVCSMGTCQMIIP